jgi:hypothetical protein
MNANVAAALGGHVAWLWLMAPPHLPSTATPTAIDETFVAEPHRRGLMEERFVVLAPRVRSAMSTASMTTPDRSRKLAVSSGDSPGGAWDSRRGTVGGALSHERRLNPSCPRRLPCAGCRAAPIRGGSARLREVCLTRLGVINDRHVC